MHTRSVIVASRCNRRSLSPSQKVSFYLIEGPGSKLHIMQMEFSSEGTIRMVSAVVLLRCNYFHEANEKSIRMRSSLGT